ncbi:hypothetical protein ITI46_06555 [Streptomyces oryzae]|uniref:Uncharacterized protein n=1 Tax=Streptomyces oryzae TaxID=1434886 RepID=A0ABS3X7J6_9ACTN|nr:hypothetical protein [Streptomyces oryzae]MBO8191354.1 hypothetical protein [Streptomyces oryzae]
MPVLAVAAAIALLLIAIGGHGGGDGHAASREQRGKPKAPAAPRGEVETPLLRITFPTGKPPQPGSAR